MTRAFARAVCRIDGHRQWWSRWQDGRIVYSTRVLRGLVGIAQRGYLDAQEARSVAAGEFVTRHCTRCGQAS